MIRERATQADVYHAYYNAGFRPKKSGSEYHGPCPVCGGVDRFYILRNGWFYCRRCCPDGKNHDAFLRIMRAIGLETPVEGTVRRSNAIRDRDRARRRREAREAAERKRRAASEAMRMIGESITDLKHPYLVAKGFCVRWPEYDGKLVVPVHSAQRKLMSAQLIDSDGTKKFLFGGQVSGGRYVLGDRYARPTWFCEGLATALAIREALVASTLPVSVVICFSASGLKKVGAAYHPHAIGIGDNDVSGAGRKALNDFAVKWIPREAGTDFCDYWQARPEDAAHTLRGLHARYLSATGTKTID